MTSALVASPGSARPAPLDEPDEGAARVVLVDPRPERRAVMNFLVKRSRRLTVVGLAASLEEAETQIRAGHADVVVVEIQMPVAAGLATIGALRGQFPALQIIVCSFHDDQRTRESARALGADGYLRKPLSVADLVALVDQTTHPLGPVDA